MGSIQGPEDFVRPNIAALTSPVLWVFDKVADHSRIGFFSCLYNRSRTSSLGVFTDLGQPTRTLVETSLTIMHLSLEIALGHSVSNGL